MSLSLKIAVRYLFSKKSHTAINAISWVAVCGVAVSAMAMVCVLSVYNGFNLLITSLYTDIDPQIEITPVLGKTLDTESPAVDSLRLIDGVAAVVPVVSDNALAVGQGGQIPVTVKGVPDFYASVSGIGNTLLDGCLAFEDTLVSYTVLGVGVANAIKVGGGFSSPVELYAPRRMARVNMINPSSSFNKTEVFCSGVFSVSQPEYDDKFVFVPIREARRLFDYTTEATSIELRLSDGADTESVKKQAAALLGDGFSVKDIFEQQAEAFSMMKIEKWITFAILAFVMMIAAFNIVGSVSMLIIDKRPNVKTLYSLGADYPLISRIFLVEGFLVSAAGTVAGVVAGLLLSAVQEHFGLLTMGDSFIVEAYPVKVVWSDVAAVTAVVLAIGFAAAWYPVRYLTRRRLKEWSLSNQ